MGSGTFDSAKYRAYASTTVGKTTAEVFTASTIKAALNPKGVKIRESRDSLDNPNSTPIIVALDVTGSMGMLADTIARKGLGTLFTGIIDRKPVTDPHVMFMAVGECRMRSLAPAGLAIRGGQPHRRAVDRHLHRARRRRQWS